MSWITENPYWLCGAGLFGLVISLILYFHLQNTKLLIFAAASIIFVVFAFVTESLIVTDREILENVVHELARDVRNNDMQAILNRIPEDKKNVRRDVEFLMPKCEFTACRASKPTILGLTDRQAELDVPVMVSAKYSTEGTGTAPVRVFLKLEKRGGEWKIIDYGYKLKGQSEFRRR